MQGERGSSCGLPYNQTYNIQLFIFRIPLYSSCKSTRRPSILYISPKFIFWVLNSTTPQSASVTKIGGYFR